MAVFKPRLKMLLLKFHGDGVISNTTVGLPMTLDGSPAALKYILVDENTGFVVLEGFSNADGSFLIDKLATDRTYRLELYGPDGATFSGGTLRGIQAQAA